MKVMVPHARNRTPPSPEQVASYSFLIDNGHSLRDALLSAVFAEYQSMRGKISDPDATMPQLSSPNELMPLMGIGTVYLLSTALQGFAYTGFLFGCTWDEEHGFGVLTHRDRVVEVSENETAWDELLAAEDAARITN